jgi:hypothetical protein
MDTSSLPPKSLSAWSRLAIISLFGGAGFAVIAALIVGGVAWHISRPVPQKSWNKTVIVANGAPGFSVSDDGTMIEFTYILENTGRGDYRIDSLDEIRIMARSKDGTLTGPFPNTASTLRLPVFVPEGQKTVVKLSLVLTDIPAREATESDTAFHERIRKFLEQRLGAVSGFAIFDSVNRYQIDLPKWLAATPKEQKP